MDILIQIFPQNMLLYNRYQQNCPVTMAALKAGKDLALSQNTSATFSCSNPSYSHKPLSSRSTVSWRLNNVSLFPHLAERTHV